MRLQKDKWILIPFFGSVCFVIIYCIATIFYPGGSQVDKNSIGFSWVNNYWCNLLNETAINGQQNAARPIATIGMIVLGFTLSIFWNVFPKSIPIGNFLKYLIQISGTIAMGISFFLFSEIEHDLVINLAGFFGMIAIVGVIIGLYKSMCYKLFMCGLLNGFLVGVNNYFYYNKGLIIYLPLIQKISFAVFLIWICCISIYVYTGKKADSVHLDDPAVYL